MAALSLLWGVVLLAGLYGVWSSVSHNRQTSWALLLIASAAFVLRISPTNTFYGLEYEDAYVYAAASRAAGLSTAAASTSGLTVCSVGSLRDCEETEAFPGHLPAFPVLLRVVQAAVPYSPRLAPTVAAVLGAVATLFIWWATWVISRSVWAAAVASLLFAFTPTLALYGGSATSEAASSVPIAAAIGATAATRRAESTAAWWKWQTLALCAALLAAYTRRENAVLIAVLPICVLSVWPHQMPRKHRFAAALVWIVFAAFVIPVLWSSLVSEVGEYGTVSFGMLRFLDTLPTVIGALFDGKWFGLLTAGACVGAVVSIREFRQRVVRFDAGLSLALVMVAAALVASYASHVRSTYQLMGVVVTEFDFLRYLSNVGVFLCILAALPASAAAVQRHRRVVAGALVVYLGVSTTLAWRLRNDLIRDEWEARTAPALAAINASAELGQKYPIVTLEPLVVQVYGSPSVKVIAMPLLTADRLQALGGQVLYIRQDHYQSDVDRRRYAEAFAALPTEHRVIREDSGWSVLILGAQGAAQSAAER